MDKSESVSVVRLARTMKRRSAAVNRKVKSARYGEWLIYSGPGKFRVDYWLAGKLLS